MQPCVQPYCTSMAKTKRVTKGVGYCTILYNKKHKSKILLPPTPHSYQTPSPSRSRGRGGSRVTPGTPRDSAASSRSTGPIRIRGTRRARRPCTSRLWGERGGGRATPLHVAIVGGAGRRLRDAPARRNCGSGEAVAHPPPRGRRRRRGGRRGRQGWWGEDQRRETTGPPPPPPPPSPGKKKSASRAGPANAAGCGGDMSAQTFWMCRRM